MNYLKQHLTLRNSYFAFLHVALFVLAFEVIVLAKQNLAFKRIPSATPEKLENGDQFSTTGLFPLNKNDDLDYASKKLVFVFSTTCSYCERNWLIWHNLAQSISPYLIPINEENMVEKIWLGLISEENVAEIVAAISIK